MPPIFISFVHEDEAVAAAVKRMLEAELKIKDGVFMSADKGQVFAGDIWIEKITEALTDAQIVLLMLSKRSVRRPWVNFEAGGAWLTRKKIVPCCYGNLRKGQLPHPYSGVQALDLPSEADYLLESVHHHLGLTTPKPQARALKAFIRGLTEPKQQEGALGAIIEDLFDHYKQLEAAIAKIDDE